MQTEKKEKEGGRRAGFSVFGARKSRAQIPYSKKKKDNQGGYSYSVPVLTNTALIPPQHAAWLKQTKELSS